MAKTARIMDTTTITELNRIAHRRGYNRALTNTFIGKLDDDGIHVVGMTLLHEHAAGVQVDPHVRAQVLCKLKDRDDPVEVWLDCDMHIFNDLPVVVKNEDGSYRQIKTWLEPEDA